MLQMLYFNLLLSTCLFIWTGCKDKLPTSTSRLIVKNASSYGVKITVFSQGRPIILDNRPVSTMAKGDSVVYTASFGTGPGCPPPAIWGLESFDKDSVVIVFDNKYRLIHTSNMKNGRFTPAINNSLDFTTIGETQKVTKLECGYR